jgi:hypothetical protein
LTSKCGLHLVVTEIIICPFPRRVKILLFTLESDHLIIAVSAADNGHDQLVGFGQGLPLESRDLFFCDGTESTDFL